MQAQNTSFPLESVSVEGTALSKEVVMDLAGLRTGTAVDKAAFDAASQKLNDTGLFESINYSYGPGPKRGYVLTLKTVDPTSPLSATIDIPGTNEDEIWKWLASRFPPLNHKVPSTDSGQLFVCRKIEEHLGESLEGHHIVVRLEAELRPGGKSAISFQPEPLPRIAEMNFTGESELNSAELATLVPKDVREQGYTDRSFRSAVELNLRRAYEEHGMYRIRFPSITAQRQPGWSVSVTTSVEEGAKFKLGDVQIIGDKLPIDDMLKAANFQKSGIAQWSQIQNSIWEAEKPVKRMGYLNATAIPERIFHDYQHVLDLRLSFKLGPLYRFGQLQVVGLPPNLEAEARKTWNMKPGDPFDYDYPKDFFRAFSRSVDPRQFKKYGVSMKKGAGENIMDFTLTFDPR
jgi:outer membrane protein assembly factor BamA